MNMTKDTKQANDKLKEMKTKEVYALLLGSKTGMTATEVAEKIGVKDTRQVRDLLREAVRQAEKEGLTTKRERAPGQAKKVYQVISKEAVDTSAKAPTSPQVPTSDASKGKQPLPSATTAAAKK